jgi:hypothetical protein
MNSIAAFQMVQALDEERRRWAERRNRSRQPQPVDIDQDVRMTSGNWRAILEFRRFVGVPSKG